MKPSILFGGFLLVMGKGLSWQGGLYRTPVEGGIPGDGRRSIQWLPFLILAEPC